MLLSFEKGSCHISCGKRLFDCLEDLNSGEIIPRCCDDLCVIVDLTDESDCLIELFLCDIACTAQDDRSGVLNLVLIELLKVLKIDPALGSVDYCDCTADFCSLNALNCSYYVRELAYTGGFDEDPVRCELFDYILQSGAEVAYETAADATGIHLCDVDAGFLEETAVDTDLAELVFDED